MTTDITILVQRLKVAAKNGCCHTLFPDDCLALVEVLEKAQQRIVELESRTVKMPHRNLGHPKLFLLCPFPYYDAEDMEKALAAAGIKVEAE